MTDNNPQESLEKNLAILLVIQNELYKINKLTEFGFLITNETHRLIKYDFAVFWQLNKLEQPTIKTISGLIDVDKQSPFVQKITECIKHYLSNSSENNTLHEITPNLFSQNFFKDEDDFNSVVIWCPFLQKENVQAGLILFREEEWQELELKVMHWLAQSYQYSYQYLNKSTPTTSFLKKLKYRKWKLGLALTLLLILLIPVRLTAVGNAIIIPKDPTIIAAPFQGVIEKIEVKPGSIVKINQPLFSLDQTELVGNVNLANKELLLTEAKLRKATQQGYNEGSDENRAEIPILEAQTKIDQNRIDYYQSLLEKSKVKAPADGLVIFDNKDDWIGQPVQTGERILKIANPENIQLDIEIPVSDIITLKTPSLGKFYPSGSISSIPITIVSISYNAKLTPSKILAYRILANFNATNNPQRIGLEGNATVYGNYVPLIVYLFRKPIHILRQYLGL